MKPNDLDKFLSTPITYKIMKTERKPRPILTKAEMVEHLRKMMKGAT